jgi:hypothetical protein
VDGRIAAEALLRLPVQLRGIQIGRPVDLVLDSDARRAIGLEVICRDDVHRFLPLAAARIAGEEIRIDSALVLFEERDLAFYRRHARTLRTLRGNAVERGRRAIGALVDVVLAEDGRIVEVVLDSGRASQRVSFDENVRIERPSRVSAA